MSSYYNTTDSGIIKSSFGKLKGIIVNSHTSGTLKLYDSLTPSAPAVATLTSTGALVAATHATSEIV